MTSAIRIHTFPLSGHAHRVELFVSLAGIPHELITVDLASGEQKQPAFLALNPAGQVPVIEDGDVVVSDANAILIYLARKYAPAYLPTQAIHEAEVQKFLTLAAGELAYGPAAARRITVFNAPLSIESAQLNAGRLLGKLETHLHAKDFLVADMPTVADIALYSYTAHAPEGNVDLVPYPNVRRWLQNIEALEGFKPMPTTHVGLRA